MTVDISVVIPAYNSESFIKQAIESALSQTYAPKEIIVVEDGSTDRTLEIVRRFPSPVMCYSQSNGGPSAARNLGVAMSCGEWVAFLDADDIWMPKKLESQVRVLTSNPKAALVYSGRTEIYEDGTRKDIVANGPDWVKNRLRFENPIFPSTVLVKRSVLLQHPWNTRFRSSEDWHFFYKLSCICEFVYIAEPTIYYRMHSQSLTHSDFESVLSCALEVSKEIQGDMSGLQKRVLAARVNARLLASAGIAARRQGAQSYLRYIIKSLVSWPFPDVAANRYKLFVKMLLQRASVFRDGSQVRNT